MTLAQSRTARHRRIVELLDNVAVRSQAELLTLLAEDGQEYAVTVTARAFTGAEEHYAPGDGHGEHGGHVGHGDGAGATSEQP